MPLYKKFRKTEQGPLSVFEPMFPRYFFRPGKPGQSISAVRTTKGVTTIVRFAFEPVVIDEVLLHRIRQLERDRHHANLVELSNLQAGQRCASSTLRSEALKALSSQNTTKWSPRMTEPSGVPAAQSCPSVSVSSWNLPLLCQSQTSV